MHVKNDHNGIFQHNFVFSSRQNNSQAHLYCFQMVLNHLLRTYKMKHTSLTVNFTSTVLISGKPSTSCTGLVLHLKNGHWDKHAREVYVFTRNWSEIFGEALFHLLVK